MKQLMVIILMVFSVVCHISADQKYQLVVMQAPSPVIIDEPENCLQFAKELDFNKPYMQLVSCQRNQGFGHALSMTYYILGKYGEQMEKDLIDKFNIEPLKKNDLDTWSSTLTLDHYYSDDRVLVILVGMTDWGGETRNEWDNPARQFFIKFDQYPEPW